MPGTLDALRVVQTEPQVASRFDPVAIPRWQWSKKFLMLLASFERVLPLRQPSHLISEPLARKLLSWSEGTIGEIYRLLNRASEIAIRKGAEHIWALQVSSEGVSNFRINRSLRRAERMLASLGYRTKQVHHIGAYLPGLPSSLAMTLSASRWN